MACGIQLVDDNTVVSYQQTYCKLIVKTCYLRAGLLQVVSTSSNKSANDEVATIKPVKWTTCSGKSVA